MTPRRGYSLCARLALYRLATEGALTLRQLAPDLASGDGCAMRRALARLVKDHWLQVFGRSARERLYCIHPRVADAATTLAPFLKPESAA